MDRAQAIHQFWSQFGLPVYDENTVPDEAVMPYITYSVATGSIDNIMALSRSLWYKSTSWEQISKKADEISAAIEIGGQCVKMGYGYAYFYRGSPFAQRLADDSSSLVRRIYLNVNCEFLTDK